MALAWEYALVVNPGPRVTLCRWCARTAAGQMHIWEAWERPGFTRPLTEANVLQELWEAALEAAERRGVSTA